MNYQRFIEQVKSEAYEQGKKDMLEALKKNAIWLDPVVYGVDNYTILQIGNQKFNLPKVLGWVVFIEKEED